MDVEQVKSGDLPMWVLAVLGLVLLFIGYKVAKVLVRVFFILMALALIAGLIWWFLHPQ